MVAFAPIQLGRTGKPWAVMIKVPTDVVMAEARALHQDLTARANASSLWQLGVGVIVALGGHPVPVVRCRQHCQADSERNLISHGVIVGLSEPPGPRKRKLDSHLAAIGTAY
jgi:hypothetical protein